MKMTPQCVANYLSGTQCHANYAFIRNELKEAGLVIVYGQSDDLMEFDGAIYDEVGCYGGWTTHVDRHGVLDSSQVDDDWDAIAQFVQRKKAARAIKAIWSEKRGEPAWSYETDIPHAAFEIMQDGEVYCRAIVFSIHDLQRRAPEDAKMYVGTKVITAWPEERDGKPGYGVQYADGYMSWSPQEAFDGAYLPLGDVGGLEPWAQRLVAESALLADKLAKLDAFVNSEKLVALDLGDQILMIRQLACMRIYAGALDDRIARLSPVDVLACAEEAQ